MKTNKNSIKDIMNDIQPLEKDQYGKLTGGFFGGSNGYDTLQQDANQSVTVEVEQGSTCGCGC